jgi:hypothetical protein
VTTARLVSIAFGLLVAAWVFGNVPFGAPDESMHYVRAIGVGRGEVLGEKVGWDDPTRSAAELRWIRQAARTVEVPDGLDPAGADCAALGGRADCLDRLPTPPGPTRVGTAVGTYQPVPYVVPGLAMRAAGAPVAGVFTGRVAMAVTTLALLIAAVVVLGGRGHHARVAGLLLATTPAVLYLTSTLNPSALEVASGVAFVAGGLSLGDRPRRAAWILTAVAGFLLATSRSPGAVWVLSVTAALVVWLGPRRVARMAKATPVPAIATALAIQLGAALNRLWELRWGPEVHVAVPRLSDIAELFPDQAGNYLRGAVGWFGYYVVRLPGPLIVTWAVLLAIVVLAALVVAPGWHRAVLTLATAGAALLATVVFVLIVAQTGFGMQARHVLPVAVILPLLAGDAVQRGRGRVAGWLRRWLLPALVLPLAAIHLVAWWVTARWGAVGPDGPIWFLGDAEWTPPAGWYVWAAVAFLGSLTLVAAGIAAGRAPVADR